MFTSVSFEKGSFSGPENCSPSRGNVSSRFPVGVKSLGDENQQIRIQLAVHKYNNAASSPVNNRCSFISPVRHSFLKNSLKNKNYDEDAESTVKSEKICGNRYEGVGAFPIVHLKKNAVRYRPIRRFNEVKVPHPELPVNRFLSNLPELCTDSKPGTRSVLDVLQDLSRKKIHSNLEESSGNKMRSKGLGGDCIGGGEVSYKPLFVQKSKVNTVLTRDNTTQTFLYGGNTSSPAGSDSSTSASAQDPKAELRRKLAKQNNEIFASLSSSITSNFAPKRKIDKISVSTNNFDVNDASAAKKQKLFANHTNDPNEKDAINFNTSSNYNSVKGSRRSKITEANATSPNKDRLTTIYLEMKNISPKAQVFQNNDEKSSGRNDKILSSKSPDGFLAKVNGFSNGNTASSESSNGSANKNENENSKSPALNFSPLSPAATSSENKENKIESNNMVLTFGIKNNVPTGGEANNSNSTSPFNFKSGAAPSVPFGTSLATTLPGENSFVSLPAAQATNFTANISPNNQTKVNGNSLGKDTFNTSIQNGQSASSPSNFKIGVENSNIVNSEQSKSNDDKTEKSSESGNKPFTFGMPNNNLQLSSSLSNFKNSVVGNLTSQNQSPQASPNTSASDQANKVVTSEAANSNVGSSKLNTTPQFSFPSPQTNSPAATSLSTTNSPFAQNVLTTTTTTTPSLKPLFTFGQNAPSLSSQQSPSDGAKKETETAKKDSTIQNSTSGVFSSSFGQNSVPTEVKSELNKSNLDTGQKDKENNNTQPTATGLISTSQANNFNFGSSSAATLLKNSNNQTLSASEQKVTNNSLFTFGQKTQVPSTQSSLPTTTGSNEVKPQTTFSFGQKPTQDSNQTTTTTTTQGIFGQKNSAGLFTFGQKSQDSSQTTSVGTSSLGQTSTTQTDSKLVTQPLMFGQSASLPNPTPMANSLGQNQTAKTENSAFGTKSESTSFGQITSTTSFGQNSSIFSPKASVFGTSNIGQATSGFSNSNSQPTNGFGAPISTQSNVVFGGGSTTTQSNASFVTPAITQSSTPFGTSATTQSTTTFGAPASSQSTGAFGIGTNSQSTSIFGAPASTLSTSSFGKPASNQPSINFGAPSTTSSTAAFGAPSVPQSGTGFGVSATTQPSNIFAFGSTASSQSSTTFNAPEVTQSASGFGLTSTSQTSFAQSFGQSKPVTTMGQTPNIFGQSTVNQNPVSTPAFGTSNISFGATTNPPNIFGQKTDSLNNTFGQNNKASSSPFGQNMTSQPFGSQNKFSFGMSTSNTTGFTTSPPNTTAASVFTFGSSTPSQGSYSGSTNASSPFAFKGPSNDTFKFGASTAKDGPGLGNSKVPNFGFGSQINSSNSSSEQKPAGGGFNFGTAQPANSTPAFSFGSTPSPSVFSFGGSGSSAGSGSTFSFGTPQPGTPFGQTATPSPAPFPVPGTFSIGSGSSQPRPRASSRLRRRP